MTVCCSTISLTLSDLSVCDTEELALWIQQVYRKYAMEDVEERFPEFDPDGDGVVSWEEYNTVTHQGLINLDDAAVVNDPEQESIRYVRA